jgi:hypothetical protein
MATFAYQKEELLKYYEKTDQIVTKHQKMFGELIGKLNSDRSEISEMVNNIDDFMKKSFSDFSDYYCDINQKQLINTYQVKYVLDINKKDFLDLESFPLDDKFIIQTNNFNLKSFLVNMTDSKNTWNNNNIKLNNIQLYNDINCNAKGYIAADLNISGVYAGHNSAANVQPSKGLTNTVYNQQLETKLTLIIDNYFNIYIPNIQTYFVYNYTPFPLYSFYSNQNKLNLYHNTLVGEDRILMYNHQNVSEKKEFDEIKKFVDESSQYLNSEDKRKLYKDEYHQYILNFYNYQQKLQYFKQFQDLSENFSNILPIVSKALTDEDNSYSIIEKDQNIFLQSNRIQELNIKLTKKEEELQYLRQERNDFIKMISDKDSEMDARNNLITELNDNLKSKISEYGKLERESVMLKTKLLKVEELTSKNAKITKNMISVEDELNLEKQKKEHEIIVNQTLMDKQIELNDKLNIVNKEKQELSYKFTEYHLRMKAKEDEIKSLKIKCETKEKEIQLTQNRLDTVIQQLRNDEEKSVAKNGEYQQILLKQIKEKTVLLSKKTQENITLEEEYNKVKVDYQDYKLRVSRLIES